MATKLYLQHDAADLGGNFWDATATVPVVGGTSGTLRVTTTTAGGTEIQLTQTAGGTLMEWVSGYATSAFTLSGTVTAGMVARESANATNAKLRAKVWRRVTAGTETLVATLDMGSELLTTDAAYTWTVTPTSTSFAVNDRLVVRFYATNQGTMAAGSVTSRTAGTNGQNFIQINENVTFSPTENTSTTYDKSLSAALTGTPRIRRSISKKLSRSVSLVATIRKTISKRLSRAAGMAASLSRIALRPVALVAAMPMAASIRREVQKRLSSALTGTATMRREIGKRLSASVSMTAVMVKGFVVNLSAGLSASASMTRTTLKGVAAPLGMTGALAKIKASIVSMSASLGMTPAMTVGRFFQRSLSAGLTLTGSMWRTISKGISAALPTIARPIAWIAYQYAAIRNDKPNWNQCPRCARKVRPNKMHQQMEYRGPRLVWTGLYVCHSCLDEPQQQGIWPRETGGDPKPVILARPRRD